MCTVYVRLMAAFLHLVFQTGSELSMNEAGCTFDGVKKTVEARKC